MRIVGGTLARARHRRPAARGPAADVRPRAREPVQYPGTRRRGFLACRRARHRPVRRHRRARARSHLARCRLLPVRRQRGRRARADPRQHRGVRADGRHAHLPPRRHRPRPGRHGGAVPPRLPRPALRQGLRRARAGARWRTASGWCRERSSSSRSGRAPRSHCRRRSRSSIAVPTATRRSSSRATPPRPAPAASRSTTGCRSSTPGKPAERTDSTT